MGGEYSASGAQSLSNSSGAKSSIGQITFGGVAFSNPTKPAVWPWLLGAVAVLALIFCFEK